MWQTQQWRKSDPFSPVPATLLTKGFILIAGNDNGFYQPLELGVQRLKAFYIIMNEATFGEKRRPVGHFE